MLPSRINLSSNDYSSLDSLYSITRQKAIRMIKNYLFKYDCNSTIYGIQHVCSTKFAGILPPGELPDYCLYLTVPH